MYPKAAFTDIIFLIGVFALFSSSFYQSSTRCDRHTATNPEREILLSSSTLIVCLASSYLFPFHRVRHSLMVGSSCSICLSCSPFRVASMTIPISLLPSFCLLIQWHLLASLASLLYTVTAGLATWVSISATELMTNGFCLPETVTGTSPSSGMSINFVYFLMVLASFISKINFSPSSA